jgi:ribosome assembly protein RRB1
MCMANLKKNFSRICFILGDPCLSFDILSDNLGMERNQYPHTILIVCGTQAEKADRNSVMVVKMSNLTKTLKVRN